MRKLAVLLLSAAMLTPFTYAAIVLAGDLLGFTEQVSPPAQTNATEPYIAVDRSDGTVYVAWQASATSVPGLPRSRPRRTGLDSLSPGS